MLLFLHCDFLRKVGGSLTTKLCVYTISSTDALKVSFNSCLEGHNQVSNPSCQVNMCLSSAGKQHRVFYTQHIASNFPKFGHNSSLSGCLYVHMQILHWQCYPEAAGPEEPVIIDSIILISSIISSP